MSDARAATANQSVNLPPWERSNENRGGPHFGALVDRIRDLMDAARFVHADDALTQELVGDLSAIVARMEDVAVPVRDAPADSRVDLPARGNISLPPFRIERIDADGVVADVTFRAFHQGQGAAHGGNVSLLFDELAGAAVVQRLDDGFPRTAYLKVNYRALTPVGRQLHVRVRVERIEGRKIFVLGTLHDKETLCADMEALFLKVPVPTF